MLSCLDSELRGSLGQGRTSPIVPVLKSDGWWDYPRGSGRSLSVSYFYSETITCSRSQPLQLQNIDGFCMGSPRMAISETEAEPHRNCAVIDSSSTCNCDEEPAPANHGALHGCDMADEHDIVLSLSGYYLKNCDPWARLFDELAEQVCFLSACALCLLNRTQLINKSREIRDRWCANLLIRLYLSFYLVRSILVRGKYPLTYSQLQNHSISSCRVLAGILLSFCLFRLYWQLLPSTTPTASPEHPLWEWASSRK